MESFNPFLVSHRTRLHGRRPNGNGFANTVSDRRATIGSRDGVHDSAMYNFEQFHHTAIQNMVINRFQKAPYVGRDDAESVDKELGWN